MMSRLLSLAAALSIFGSMTHAQSSLGAQGLSVELGFGLTDDGRHTSTGLAQLDVMVTPFHGLQLDAALSDDANAVLGQIGAHLYMRPNDAQKYGLFAVVSDLDGWSVQYVTAGLEGRFQHAESAAFDLQLGLGATTSMGGTSTRDWDYIYASAGYLWDINDETTLSARLTVSEFDEDGFRAVGMDSTLRLSHSPNGSNFGIFGELNNSALFGADRATPITSMAFGVTINLGASGDSVMDRPFAIASPFDQLVTRGIVQSF